MSVMIHYYKTHPEPFSATAAGAKPYDVRLDDRPVRPRVGDLLVLQEWEPHEPSCEKCLVKAEGHPAGDFTGRQLELRVTYITKPETWGLPPNVFIMGHRPKEAR